MLFFSFISSYLYWVTFISYATFHWRRLSLLSELNICQGKFYWGPKKILLVLVIKLWQQCLNLFKILSKLVCISKKEMGDGGGSKSYFVAQVIYLRLERYEWYWHICHYLWLKWSNLFPTLLPQCFALFFFFKVFNYGLIRDYGNTTFAQCKSPKFQLSFLFMHTNSKKIFFFFKSKLILMISCFFVMWMNILYSLSIEINIKQYFLVEWIKNYNVDFWVTSLTKTNLFVTSLAPLNNLFQLKSNSQKTI